jgi:hypothetical protein
MREARYDQTAELDEVVADDVTHFHLERMNTGAWWIGITHTDGTVTHINLAAKRPNTTAVKGVCTFDG